MNEEEVLNELLALGVQEQDLIRSFEKRLKTSYEHRKLAIALLDAVKSNDSVNAKKLISRIRGVLSVFSGVGYEARELDLLKRETMLLDVEDSVLQEELAEARQLYAKGKLGADARKKLAVLLSEFEEVVKDEHRARELQDHIRAVIQRMPSIAERMASLVNHELESLSRLESDLNQETARDVLACANSLYHVMLEEKHNVIDPVNVLLKEKIDVESKAKRLLESRDVITLADVRSDLRSLTNPEEVVDYVIALQNHPRFHGDKCEITLPRILSRYMRYSRYKEKKAKKAAKKRVTSRLSELESEIKTDPLLYMMFNRKHFNKEIINMITAAHSSRDFLTLILVDIDDFKSVNDKFGHQKGDEVLINIGQIIYSAKRDSDVLCRYGGEEFAMLCFGLSPADAELVAERLRKEVEEGTEGLVPDRGSVTISIGVATYSGADELSEGELKNAAEGLIKAADEALYDAKEAGKNRVVVAESAVTI